MPIAWLSMVDWRHQESLRMLETIATFRHDREVIRPMPLITMQELFVRAPLADPKRRTQRKREAPSGGLA